MAYIPVWIQVVDGNNAPVSGAKIFTYVGPDTNTPQASYTSSDGSVAETNPALANAAGITVIWLDDSLNYRVKVTDSGEGTVYYDQENINPSNVGGFFLIANGVSDQSLLTTSDVEFANITTGLINGISIQDLQSQLGEFSELTPSEIAQIANIDASTFSSTAWANLAQWSSKLVNFTGLSDGDHISWDDSTSRFVVSDSIKDDAIGLNTSPDPAIPLKVNAETGALGALFTRSDDSAGFGPHLQVQRNSTTPAAGDILGRISFVGKNDLSTNEFYAMVDARIEEESENDARGALYISAAEGGVQGRQVAIFSPHKSYILSPISWTRSINNSSGDDFTDPQYAEDYAHHRMITNIDAQMATGSNGSALAVGASLQQSVGQNSKSIGTVIGYKARQVFYNYSSSSANSSYSEPAPTFNIQRCEAGYDNANINMWGTDWNQQGPSERRYSIASWASATQLTLTGGDFDDNAVDNTVVITGAGVGGADLLTKIASVQSPSDITLSDPATSQPTGQVFRVNVARLMIGQQIYQANWSETPEPDGNIFKGVYGKVISLNMPGAGAGGNTFINTSQETYEADAGMAIVGFSGTSGVSGVTSRTIEGTDTTAKSAAKVMYRAGGGGGGWGTFERSKYKIGFQAQDHLSYAFHAKDRHPENTGHGMFIEKSAGNVGIGIQPVDGIPLHIEADATSSRGLRVNLNNDGLNGARIELAKNSASPAAGDTLGQIDFLGRNDATDVKIYGRIISKVLNATDNAEESELSFSLLKNTGVNDTYVTSLALTPDAILANVPLVQGGGKLYADMQSIPSSTLSDGDRVYVSGRTVVAIGEGAFVYRTGDYTQDVLNDPQAGVYVPLDDDAAGSTGCLVRVIDHGELRPEFWGALGNGTGDDGVYFNYMFDFIRNSTDFSGNVAYSVKLVSKARYRIVTSINATALRPYSFIFDLNNSQIEGACVGRFVLDCIYSRNFVIKNGTFYGDPNNIPDGAILLGRRDSTPSAGHKVENVTFQSFWKKGAYWNYASENSRVSSCSGYNQYPAPIYVLDPIQEEAITSYQTITNGVGVLQSANENYFDSTNGSSYAGAPALKVTGTTRTTELVNCYFAAWGGDSVHISGNQELMKLNAHIEPRQGVISNSTISVSNIDSSTDEITATNHKLYNGNIVRFSDVGGLTGISTSTDYFIIVVDEDTFKIATSYSNAIAAAAINISGTYSGVSLVRLRDCRANVRFLTSKGDIVVRDFYLADHKTDAEDAVIDTDSANNSLTIINGELRVPTTLSSPKLFGDVNASVDFQGDVFVGDDAGLNDISNLSSFKGNISTESTLSAMIGLDVISSGSVRSLADGLVHNFGPYGFGVTPNSGVPVLIEANNSNGIGVRIQRSTNADNAPAVSELFQSGRTPSAGTNLGKLLFSGRENDGTGLVAYSSIESDCGTASDGLSSGDGRVSIKTLRDNALSERILLDENDGIVVEGVRIDTGAPNAGDALVYDGAAFIPSPSGETSLFIPARDLVAESLATTGNATQISSATVPVVVLPDGVGNVELSTWIQVPDGASGKKISSIDVTYIPSAPATSGDMAFFAFQQSTSSNIDSLTQQASGLVTSTVPTTGDALQTVNIPMNTGASTLAAGQNIIVRVRRQSNNANDNVSPATDCEVTAIRVNFS